MWEPWIGKYGPTRATVQANMMKPEWLIEIVIIAACAKDYPEEEEEEEKEIAAPAEVEDKKDEAAAEVKAE